MKYCILLICILFSLIGRTSHIVGGDIYYDYLGNNQYKFFITVYRDCFSSGAPYDDPLFLGVFKQSGLYETVEVPFPGSTILPINYSNPCATPPNNVCVEKAVYTTVITLPPVPGGYTVAYQRCCRGPNVTNLYNPDDTGLTLVATVPGSNTGNQQNSSPRFVNYPPLILCNNDILHFDHSATDPDGDQLVYSLVAPFAGANSTNPAPNPPPPPPYSPVTWNGGFTTTTPMGGGASITINPTTGMLTVDPQMLGLFVVGVRVQEFRNGVLVGETVRDFLFKVFNCNITMQALLPTQEELSTFVSYCQGLTVQFENNSYGGSNYKWDFGVLGTTSDVSTNFEPVFTYPAPGTYQAMLVVNPGWSCTDTAYINLILNNEFSVSYTSQDSLCIVGNSFDFVANASSGNPTYEWSFGPNASVGTSTSISVPNVTFSTSGSIPITLTGNNGTCTDTYIAPIYIFPEPTAAISLPPNYQCEGLTVQFGNPSTGTTGYHWDFGLSGLSTDTSNAVTPTFSFPVGGNYTVTLIGFSNGACIDTTSILIDVNELLEVSFTHDDSLCITGNQFDFIGSVNGPTDVQWAWNFGPNASTSTSTDLSVFDVHFSTSGSIPISLTGYFDACTLTETQSIFIFKEPTIDFSVENGPFCAPDWVQFTNLSSADTPMQFIWSFGDETVSNETNPNHLYPIVGSYSVSLFVITTDGCADTLFKMIQDAVTLHPSPISAFTINPSTVTICRPEVVFTDQSQGATEIMYDFDDQGLVGYDANTIHSYTSSGWLRPMQVAFNEWGCTDTSYRELFVEPFTIYFPNTFTPDGNEFNNEFRGYVGLELVAWELRIFDRWGQEVFSSDEYEEGWDGSYKTLPAQQGAYAYVVNYKSCNKPDEWQTLSGHVNLLR